MNTKNRVFSKLFKDKTKELKGVQLKKYKATLSILDDFSYGQFDEINDEIDNLGYFVNEWFPDRFDQWYELGREIYSVYFQNAEPFITEADLNKDSELIDTIYETAYELGIEPEQIYPSINDHINVIQDGYAYIEAFEEQKKEFENESKSV